MPKIIGFTHEGNPIYTKTVVKPTEKYHPKRSRPRRLEFNLVNLPDVSPTDGGVIIDGIFYATRDVPQALKHFLATKRY